MGFLSNTAQILFRGALASYLLLYAISFKANPTQWHSTITDNLTHLATHLNSPPDNVSEIVSQWLGVYCQWLVLVSLMVVSGLRSGKVLSIVALLVNLLLCWNQTQILFLGMQLIMLGSVMC